MYFRGQEQTAMETYLRRLVEAGKLPASALNILEQEKAEIRTRPASEFVYRHTKKFGPEFALPGSTTMGLGQPVRLGGLSRWTVDDVSIFDVKTGRKLAATPRREPSIFEIKRAAAIERAATQSPLVGKYRLYPRLSPGRALFWGTIVAFAGTMVGTKLACIVLDIKSVDEVESKMRMALKPFKTFIQAKFTPVNGALLTAGSGSVDSTSLNRFASQLKEKFSYDRH